jgi:hypothetical protein
MTNDELQNKLDKVITQLKKAHDDDNHKKISHCVTKLNKLWEKASKIMLKKAEQDGVYKPDQS